MRATASSRCGDPEETAFAGESLEPRIELPQRSALVIGRVFAADDDDRLVAYALAKQIQLTPLGNQS
jgi:hypothetical protein